MRKSYTIGAHCDVTGKTYTLCSASFPFLPFEWATATNFAFSYKTKKEAKRAALEKGLNVPFFIRGPRGGEYPVQGK